MTPAMMQASAAIADPMNTDRRSALRPLLTRYAVTIASTRAISRPSRNVMRKLAPMNIDIRVT